MTPDPGQIIYYILLGVAALAAAIYTGRKHPSSAWQTIVDELHKEVREQDVRIDKLEHATTALRVELADKVVEIHVLQGEKNALEKRVAALEDENSKLYGKLDYERRRRRELEAIVKGTANGGA